MSWDIFVQQIPEDVRHVGDIPSDFVPGPLGPRAEIVAGIRDVFPTVDFSDPEWGRVEEDGFSIEINMDAEDPVTSFALHARGDGVAPAIAALLDRLGLRAFDPQSATGLFDPETSAQSHDAWRSIEIRLWNPSVDQPIRRTSASIPNRADVELR